MVEQAKSLAELKQQLELMQTMEQLAQVGAWSVELPSFEVTSSPGIYKVFEQDTDVSQDLFEAMNRCLPEYRPTMAAIWEKAFADGEPFAHEIPCMTAKNRLVWLRSIGLPEMEDGAVVRIRGVLVDITDEHQALEDVNQLNSELESRVLKRTASLAAANAELEAFSYSVSHDLRSPLRAITGFAHLMETRHSQNLDPKARHYLDNIITAGERMSTLIEELLRYSQIGSEVTVNRAVDMQQILERLHDTFSERLQTLSANIHFMLPVPTPLGDPTLIEQILNNLIDNALKYSRPDTPPIIRITAENHAGTIAFRVIDNGIGIEPEYHERIFEVFQRLHTEAEYPGTGIGLASARKAAERMGGTLAVQSTLGVGSTFELQLPSAG